MKTHYKSLKELAEVNNIQIFYTCEKCEHSRYIICRDNETHQNAIFKYLKDNGGYVLANSQPIFEKDVDNLIESFHTLCHPEDLKSC
jgi:hypothetical protein